MLTSHHRNGSRSGIFFVTIYSFTPQTMNNSTLHPCSISLTDSISTNLVMMIPNWHPIKRPSPNSLRISMQKWKWEKSKKRHNKIKKKEIKAFNCFLSPWKTSLLKPSTFIFCWSSLSVESFSGMGSVKSVKNLLKKIRKKSKNNNDLWF